MVGEWRSTTVRQLVEEGVLERPIDGNHGEIHPKTSDFVEHGIPFIMASDLVGGRVDTKHCAFISEKHARALRKGFALPGDVLISHKATMGRTALVDQLDVPFLMLTPQVTYYRVRDPSRLVARYLKLYFDSPDFQALFETWGQKGSTRAYLGITAQLDLPIVLPSPAEQRAIAHILGTLDDNIALNRWMNETLEAIARALFKSWFVDFDPVRAKAEGRNPGLPQPLADLFPDSFEDSELGEIPRGWGLSRLGDEVETLLGGTPSRVEASFWGGDIPWINSGKANEFRIVEPSEFITQAGLDSSATKLLPARTTVIAITGATLGQVSITEIATCANQSIVGVLGSAALPSEFIYFWVKENIDRLIASQTGGAQQHINKKNVNELPIVVPGKGVVSAYMRTARATFDRIKESCFESRTLGALHDALLPKLISGELRVGHPERFAEAIQ